MSDIFRKVALERLSSPEQLDQLLEVTRPAHWLALSALGLVVAAALMWGFLGSVPTEAQGEGILLRHGGVADLVATGSGQVEEVLVAVGDRIEKGQEVARIRQEGLSRQLEETRARKAALEGDYQRLLGYAGEQQRLSSANLEQQRGDLNRTIATLEREVELAAQRVTADQALLADGLITQQTLLDAERDLNTLKDRLAAQRLELAGLGLKR
ncbi:MAG TPA: hypothetical protein PK413_13535, partial [Thermoanaerobaculia bacterium]|nr:hypothetical protein [Thermoanaerobaculia bacterium]